MCSILYTVNNTHSHVSYEYHLKNTALSYSYSLYKETYERRVQRPVLIKVSAEGDSNVGDCPASMLAMQISNKLSDKLPCVGEGGSGISFSLYSPLYLLSIALR